MLFRFAQEKKPKQTPRSTPKRQQLAALMDRRDHLTEQMAREKNRVQNTYKCIERSMKKMIKFIEKEIISIEKEIQSIISSDKLLSAQHDIMTAVSDVTT